MNSQERLEAVKEARLLVRKARQLCLHAGIETIPIVVDGGDDRIAVRSEAMELRIDTEALLYLLRFS